MDTLIGGHYTAAEFICDEIAEECGDHPVSYYARAAVLYAKFFDLEDSAGRGEFDLLIDSCLFACKKHLLGSRSNSDQARIFYLRGSAMSMQGLTYRQDGRTFSTIRRLKDSHRSFDKAISLDPRFYDSYLGRGAYRFGVASEAPMLTWLPFIPSKRSGLDDMWLAIDSSRFSTFPALSALVWFVIEDDNFELADSICAAGLSRFPESRTFLWPLLSLLKKQKHYEQADSAAQVLLKQYLALNGNGYDVTGLYYTLSELADARGESELAVAYARKALEVPRTPYAEQRREKTLNNLRERLQSASQTPP